MLVPANVLFEELAMKELLYIQLVDQLRKKIQLGVLKPGDMLPSENELSQEYQISRVTVRKSLSLLEQEGYTYSAPGKGYFVREPVTDKYILNFNEMNNAGGSAASSKLLEVNVVPPSTKMMYELQIPDDRYVIVIKRLLLAEGAPIAYDVKYLPYNRGLPLVEREIKYATFPELAGKKTSLFSIKKDLKICAKNASGEICALLNVEEGHPLLVISQKLYTDENKVIGWGEIYYIAEFCELNAMWSFGQRLYDNG